MSRCVSIVDNNGPMGLKVDNSTDSTSIGTGSITTDGGLSVTKNMYVGGNLFVEEVDNAVDAVIKLVGEDSGTYTRTGYITMKSSTAGNKSMEFWNDSTDTTGTNTIFSFRNSAETEIAHISYDGSLGLDGNIDLASGKHISFINSAWEIGFNISALTTEQLTSNTFQIQVANATTQGFQVTDGTTAMFEVAGNTGGTTTFRNDIITFDGASAILLDDATHIQWLDGNWQLGRNIESASGESLTSNTIQVKVFNGTGQGFQVINSANVAVFEVGGNLTNNPGVSCTLLRITQRWGLECS